MKEKVTFKIFESFRPGGLIWYANRVDNLLGHRGRTGKEIVEAMVSHSGEMGVETIPSHVNSLKIQGNGFIVVHDDAEEYFEEVIIATGSRPRKIDLENVQYRIEYEEDLKDMDILIIGGGDLALDNALRARNMGARVTILHRSNIKANLTLMDEVRLAGVKMVKGSEKDLGVVGGRYSLNGRETFDRVAAFIGRSCRVDLLEGMQGLNTEGSSRSTGVNGLYLIGDAASLEHSQAANAMSSGIACAMDIARKVRLNGDSDGERC